MGQRLTVLVIDHLLLDAAELVDILSREGCQVFCPDHANEIIHPFHLEHIDLLCLNPYTQYQSGWQTIVKIKDTARLNAIPILFLCDNNDASMQESCMLEGCFDVLIKPFSYRQIAFKINALAEFRAMQKTLSTQRDEMITHSEKVLYDHHLAKIVYENITHSNCLKDAALSHFHYGSHTFNGDVILAAYKPSGGMHLVLGDFTGQGLSAAIGALPLADIFFDWTERGFLLKQIILEINDRLNDILPPNMFCSAAFVDINPNNDGIEIWNGGLPDLLYFSSANKLPKRFKSKNIPLGILSSDVIDYQIDHALFTPGDRLLMFSDGVHEAVDLMGRMFCDAILHPLYKGEVASDHAVDWLIQQLQQEEILENPHDDMSCIGVRLDVNIGMEVAKRKSLPGYYEVPADFSFEYVLGADSLRSTDPLPYLLQILTTVPGLNHFSSQIFMILSELYSNALEHGVLNLSSNKKSSHDGFSQYYEERKIRLAELKMGYIKFSARVVSDTSQRLLILSVEDSGDGFDFTNLNYNLPCSELLYNRGLALLNRLCSKLEFSNGGRVVTAHYQW